MSVVELYCCFDCNLLQGIDSVDPSGRTMKPIYKIKRLSTGDWQFGVHVQTKINPVWSDNVDELYKLWIAKKVLE